MLSFARLTSFLLFVISLSLLTCASSTSQTSELVARDYGYGNDNGSHSPGEVVLKILADVKGDVEAELEVMAHVNVAADLAVHADVLIGHLQHAAEVILAVGAKVDVSVILQAQIAAEVVAIIKIVVDAFIALSAKFGIEAIVAILVKLDAAIHLLLVNLDICISGLLSIVAKLLLDVGVKVFVEANLHLCAQVLALLG